MDPNQQPYQQQPPPQVTFSNLKMYSLNTKQCLYNQFLKASLPWECHYSQHHLDIKLINLMLSSSSNLSQVVRLRSYPDHKQKPL